MKKYEYTDDIYQDIDGLIIELRNLGANAISDRLHLLIHESSWTTCSELFEELLKPLSESLIHKKSLNDLSIDKIEGMISFMRSHLSGKK